MYFYELVISQPLLCLPSAARVNEMINRSRIMRRQTMKSDKRKERRRQLRRSAWIVAGSDKLRECILSDVSDAGARIEVDGPQPLPDTFVLFLSQNGAARRNCRVAWRDGKHNGVKFERSPARRLGKANRLAPVPSAEVEHT
jgi:hypothetical protein